MSHKKFGPDRFSRFDVYWIQTDRQTDRQAKFIYRLSRFLEELNTDTNSLYLCNLIFDITNLDYQNPYSLKYQRLTTPDKDKGIRKSDLWHISQIDLNCYDKLHQYLRLGQL